MMTRRYEPYKHVEDLTFDHKIIDDHIAKADHRGYARGYAACVRHFAKLKEQGKGSYSEGDKLLLQLMKCSMSVSGIRTIINVPTPLVDSIKEHLEAVSQGGAGSGVVD
jgi:hypothetical protein